MRPSTHMDLNTKIDLSFITEQPRYVLYGAGLIFIGVVLIIIGLFLL